MVSALPPARVQTRFKLSFLCYESRVALRRNLRPRAAPYAVVASLLASLCVSLRHRSHPSASL